MNFHGQRIHLASSKNFVFESNQTQGKEGESHSVLQFGKAQKRDDGTMQFSLDFRSPVAPIQAFAVLLSACKWIGPKAK